MSLISEWSTIANDNGTLGSTPNYWPENQAPSTVNNCAREMMRAVRVQWNDAQWFNWGYTVTKVSGNSFTVATAAGGWNTVTLPAAFEVGGRIKCATTTNIYGTIDTVSVSALSTLVTFSPDSGTLGASFTSVFNSIISPTNISVPPSITGGGGGSSTGNVIEVAQANTFVGNEWVYLNGSTWTTASNGTPATAEAVGVVLTTPAPTGTTFSVQLSGRVIGLVGLTAGLFYWLDASGGLTATPPSGIGDIGKVQKPLLIADGTTTGIILNYRGSEIVSLGQGQGGLLNIQVFTTTGAQTWTKTSGANNALVQVVGGGGGGGSAAPSAGGGGGGAGGFSQKLIDVTSISSETVTVGAGGIGGSAGTTSSFGSHATATGGAAGANGADGGFGSPGGGGAGGVGASGDINAYGQGGQGGANNLGGGGGNSYFGGGAAAYLGASSTPGRPFGGGASGGGNTSAGGNTGGNGIVIIWEYS